MEFNLIGVSGIATLSRKVTSGDSIISSGEIMVDRDIVHRADVVWCLVIE
jgi:hypothetical protein